MSAPIEITRLAKSGGPLTKRVYLSDTGALTSDGSACLMADGAACRVRLDSLGAFADLIARLDPHEAIALGALRPDLPDQVKVTTKRRLDQLNGAASAELIARTGDYIRYGRDAPALALVDVDTKGLPSEVAGRVKEVGGFWKALASVAPQLDQAGRVLRRSTSSGLSRSDTGEQLAGSNGVHVFVLVQNGSDIERFLRTLHARCWLHGLGWLMIGAGGQLLERSLVDQSVYAPERLVFEGAPVLVAPFVQDRAQRAPVVTPGVAIDTRAACPNLTQAEQARLRDLRAAEAHRIAPQSAKARAAFVTTQAARIAERTGISKLLSIRVVERQCAGILLPAIALPFDAAEFDGCTVANILADPDRFDGATLADPLEGAEYGRCKAKVMRRADGTPWINSFAHGHTVYELRHDAASIEAAILAATPEEAAERFVKLLLAGDVAADEEQRLRDLVMERSGVRARPLGAKIKAALEEQKKRRAAEDRERHAAERADTRLRLPVPQPDDERLPVLRMLDEILGGVREAVPPMRDVEGRPVEVRCRMPMLVHELTSKGANADEATGTRLPPPELPLLSRHDKYSLSHEIERHVAFEMQTEKDGARPVALPPAFVEHYLQYRDSTLPRVGAVVTAPLVLPDGTLLAPDGLDRERKLVFRIDPALTAIVPPPASCTRQAVAAAMTYLTNKWLTDVSSDFAGKCVVIGAALTVLERAILPERPAFFISAGQRGGGKTTTANMIAVATTGKRAPAAAWSSSEEERRKALLSYLSEGLAILVFDNIPRGAAISCPSIEKALTAETYSDRVLGQTESRTVPATSVLIFTGNNIAPKGDMASRSLSARIDVDRPDPENRSFKHPDPIGWTLANRGEILASLFTILLGNPQLRAPEPPRTRFKMWWHLVGSAVEYAAATLDQAVDFESLFLSYEAEDETTNAIAGALDIMRGTWGDSSFMADDVAKLITDPMTGEIDKSRELKGCLDAACERPMPLATGRAVTWRLNAFAGAPVRVGDHVMLLKKVAAVGSGGKATHYGNRYQVRLV